MGLDLNRTKHSRFEEPERRPSLKNTRVLIAFIATLTLLPATLFAARAGERLEGNTLHFSPKIEFGSAKLRILGPEEYSSDMEFSGGAPIELPLGDALTDGRYKYQLRLDPIDSEERPVYVSSLFFVEDGVAISRGNQREKMGVLKERLAHQQANAAYAANAQQERVRQFPFDPATRPGRVQRNNAAGIGYLYPYSTFGYGLCVGEFCPDYVNQPPPEGIGSYLYGQAQIRAPYFAGITMSTVPPYGPPDAATDGGPFGFYLPWNVGAYGPYFTVSSYYGFPFVIDPFQGNIGLFGLYPPETVMGGARAGDGYGYGFPASIYIGRSDGSASIFLSNEGAGARRQMLVLENDGPAEIVLKDTSRSLSWKLDTRADNFEINRGASGTTEFVLSRNGDLTIKGTLTQGSSRTLKENFTPVDGEKMLEEVLNLPLLSWNYKERAPDDRHVGPMAEDFFAAFGYGDSDKSLAPSDAAGVALAAIQGLHTKLAARDEEILLLRQQLEELSVKFDRRFSSDSALKPEAPPGISGEP